MDPDVPETLVPDVVGADELNVDNLTEDNYASGSESVYDATIRKKFAFVNLFHFTNICITFMTHCHARYYLFKL